MDQWIYENLFVFILAGFSGFDLIKRLVVRVYAAIVSFPLKCYLKVVAGLAAGNPVMRRRRHWDGGIE